MPGQLQPRILVVDDEEQVLAFLRAKLRVSGYDIVTARNGLEALKLAQAQDPDLVLLDLNMPKMDGLDALKVLRTFSTVPVIVLSARSENADKVKAFTLGADDFLPKPFNPDELVARIKAVKRRVQQTSSAEATKLLTFGDVMIDFQKHSVVVGGQLTSLTRIEWLLLVELARNAGRLVTYEELLTRVWGPEYRNDVEVLWTWMSRLRTKIEKRSSLPRCIRTIHKTGYILANCPE